MSAAKKPIEEKNYFIGDYVTSLVRFCITFVNIL